MDKQNSTFAGFILLDEIYWDKEKIVSDFTSDWEDDISNKDETEDALVFDVSEMTVAISLVRKIIPNEEAEKNAATNYIWKEALETTKTHKAYIIVAILGRKATAIEAGKLYVKICSSILKQENAIGIYTSGTVFEPKFYIEASNMIRENELPILNWVYIGVYPSEKGISLYTYGMKNFGKKEIEIIDSEKPSNDVYSFLYAIVHYIIRNDAALKDGETIGITENERYKVLLNDGKAYKENTLKVLF